MAESQPSAADLLAGVIEYLERDLLPTLEGRHRFHVRVAANVLGILKRELELGRGIAEAERTRLTALLGQDGDRDALNRELARRIRDGEIAADDELVEHLLRSIGEALAINNPKWNSVELNDVVATVQRWAAAEPIVNRVHLFGSVLRLVDCDPRDIDVAIELAVPDAELISAFMDNAQRWRTQLGAQLPRQVDLQLAHPSAPNVWRYIADSGRLIFSRQDSG